MIEPSPPWSLAMLVCGIETSSRFGEVALLDVEGACRTVPFPGELSHAKDLVPTLKRLLEACGIAPAAIDLIAVDHGPGSYTGIRVGVTAAKVLALALARPIAPVNSMEVLGRTIRAAPGASFACAAPVLDAKLGQVYAAAFRLEPFERTLGDFVGSAGELVPRLPPGTLVFGDGVARYRDAFAGFPVGPDEWARPRAEIVARLGAEAFAARGGVDPDEIAPLYLRISHAEQKLKERGARA